MNEVQVTDANSVGSRLADLLVLACTAMDEATAAFLGGEPALSSALAAAELALREVRGGIEDHASFVLAVPEHVSAADVRRIVAEVHVNATIEAMASLARQVADIAHSRPPRSAPPEPLAEILGQMNRVSLMVAAGIADLMRRRSVRLPEETDVHREVRHLQRRLLAACPDAVLAAAVDASLVGRLYEQFAEHAVSLTDHARLLAGTVPNP